MVQYVYTTPKRRREYKEHALTDGGIFYMHERADGYGSNFPIYSETVAGKRYTLSNQRIEFNKYNGISSTSILAIIGRHVIVKLSDGKGVRVGKVADFDNAADQYIVHFGNEISKYEKTDLRKVILNF